MYRSVEIWAAISLGVLLLAGCSIPGFGSPSYTDHVNTLKNAISTYNSSQGTGLPNTGAACQAADKTLSDDHTETALASPPSGHASEGRDLQRAAQEALAGFRDCAASASTLNYPLMVRANQEMSASNQWIRAAHAAN